MRQREKNSNPPSRDLQRRSPIAGQGSDPPGASRERHITISLQAGDGGWLGRLLFGLLALVLLVFAALFSMALLLWLGLAVLVLLAAMILKGSLSRRPPR